MFEGLPSFVPLAFLIASAACFGGARSPFWMASAFFVGLPFEDREAASELSGHPGRALATTTSAHAACRPFAAAATHPVTGVGFAALDRSCPPGGSLSTASTAHAIAGGRAPAAETWRIELR
jgi:hypothetical protein